MGAIILLVLLALILVAIGALCVNDGGLITGIMALAMGTSIVLLITTVEHSRVVERDKFMSKHGYTWDENQYAKVKITKTVEPFKEVK